MKIKPSNIGALVLGILSSLPIGACKTEETRTTTSRTDNIFLSPAKDSYVKGHTDSFPVGAYGFEISPNVNIQEFGIDGRPVNYGKINLSNGNQFLYPTESFPEGRHEVYAVVNGFRYTLPHTIDRTKPTIEDSFESKYTRMFTVNDNFKIKEVHLQRSRYRQPPERLEEGRHYSKVIAGDSAVLTIDRTLDLSDLEIRIVDYAGNARVEKVKDYFKKVPTS